MKRSPKTMDELSDEFHDLIFTETLPIRRGIAQDPDFNIVANLETYIAKLEAFKEKARKITETETE